MGKKDIKIYGDSISTCWRFQKEGYEVYYNKERAEYNQLKSERDFWWWPVAEQLAMKDGSIAKIENHSYSGSTVKGSEFPSGASDQRIRRMSNPYFECAFILIYMGFNDFGHRVPVYPVPGEEDFYSAYVAMLRKMKELFPEAHILPATLLMTKSDVHPQWKFPEEERFKEYNKAISDAAAACGCTLVDLTKARVPGMKSEVRLNTMDRYHSHPDVEGHDLLAYCWIDQLKKQHIL